MKSNRLSVLVFLLMFSLACGLTGTATNVPEIASPTFTPPPASNLSQSLTMQSMPFNETGTAPVYTLTAQIPNLQGSSDARVTTFNEYLSQIVLSQLDQYRKDVIAFASNPPVTGGSSFDMQYSVIGQRADIWSIKFEISQGNCRGKCRRKLRSWIRRRSCKNQLRCPPEWSRPWLGARSPAIEFPQLRWKGEVVFSWFGG